MKYRISNSALNHYILIYEELIVVTAYGLVDGYIDSISEDEKQHYKIILLCITLENINKK